MEQVLADKESELLQHYHAAVCQALQRRGLAGESAAYTADVMQEHYELAMMDYVRFMAGWGWWGAAGFAQARCRALLDKWAPRLAGAVTS